MQRVSKPLNCLRVNCIEGEKHFLMWSSFFYGFQVLCHIEKDLLLLRLLKMPPLIASIIFSFFWPHPRHVGSQFPNQGSNLHPLRWKHGVLAPGPPGKSLFFLFYILIFHPFGLFSPRWLPSCPNSLYQTFIFYLQILNIFFVYLSLEFLFCSIDHVPCYINLL